MGSDRQTIQQSLAEVIDELQESGDNGDPEGLAPRVQGVSSYDHVVHHDRASTQQKALIFLHIPKTAGGTLHRIIRRQFPNNATYDTFVVDSAGARIRADAFKQLPEEARGRIRYLRSHYPFGLHEYIPQQSTYVTLLRHPVDRMISLYYYTLQSPGHPLYEKLISGNMSLDDYVRSELATRQANLQTRFVSGHWSLTDSGTSPSDILETAKRNIQEHFDIVGLSEMFDESLALLRRAFGWRNALYTKRNVSKGRPRKEDIAKDTFRLIERHNEQDLELYNYAKERFVRLIDKQDSSFKSEVQRLRLYNQVYQLANSPYFLTVRLYLTFRSFRNGRRYLGYRLNSAR